MEIYNWDQIRVEQLNPLIARRAIHSAQMTIARFEIQQGAVIPAHAHVNEQVTSVEKGALMFQIGSEQQVLKAGQTLVIPSSVSHGVMAMEDTVVVDIFTPRREDWIRGNDAYLRR
jgi:quercetin dioxygenase-like cupin family protein